MPRGQPNNTKRQRLENGGRSPPATAATPQPPATVIIDSPPGVVDDELARLDIDPEFKESLRQMSPNSRREIINDIVRNQQFARAEQLAAQQNEELARQRQQRVQQMEEASRNQRNARGPFTAMLEEGDEYELEGDDDDNDEEDDDDDDDDDSDEDVTERAIPRRRGRGGPPRDEGDVFAQLLMHAMSQHLGGRRGRGRGGRGGPHLFAQLHPLLQHIQQLMSHREMGLDRDIDTMSYEELLELQDRIGYVSKGLRPQEVAACTQRCEGGKATSADENCVICQCALSGEDGDDDDDVRDIPPCLQLKRCGHKFHQECLEQWLRASKTCPLCKADVL